MPRSVNHVASRERRKKILKLTRGYYGARKNVWTVAKNTWEKGLTYAYRDRKDKKRNGEAIHLIVPEHIGKVKDIKLTYEEMDDFFAK